MEPARDEGARVAAVCSGAFALAGAGLLDGRRATTHWKYAERLAQRFPEVEVDSDVHYIDDDGVITSAGSAAGVDMGLHLIRTDHGAIIANAVARRLVMPPHRDGGQQQFVAEPVPERREDGSFAQTLERLVANLSAEHSISSMARQARMSERSFARKFRAATGTTPQRWLQRERVRAAQALLETSGPRRPLTGARSESARADPEPEERPQRDPPRRRRR